MYAIYIKIFVEIRRRSALVTTGRQVDNDVTDTNLQASRPSSPAMTSPHCLARSLGGKTKTCTTCSSSPLIGAVCDGSTSTSHQFLTPAIGNGITGQFAVNSSPTVNICTERGGSDSSLLNGCNQMPDIKTVFSINTVDQHVNLMDTSDGDVTTQHQYVNPSFVKNMSNPTNLKRDRPKSNIEMDTRSVGGPGHVSTARMRVGTVATGSWDERRAAMSYNKDDFAIDLKTRRIYNKSEGRARVQSHFNEERQHSNLCSQGRPATPSHFGTPPPGKNTSDGRHCLKCTTTLRQPADADSCSVVTIAKSRETIQNKNRSFESFIPRVGQTESTTSSSCGYCWTMLVNKLTRSDINIVLDETPNDMSPCLTCSGRRFVRRRPNGIGWRTIHGLLTPPSFTNSPGGSSSSFGSSSLLMKEVKAARQLGVIMAVFTLCFCPYFVCYMVVALCETCVGDRLMTVVTWIGYLNSALNPVLYPLCNAKFRRKFKEMIRWNWRTLSLFSPPSPISSHRFTRAEVSTAPSPASPRAPRGAVCSERRCLRE